MITIVIIRHHNLLKCIEVYIFPRSKLVLHKDMNIFCYWAILLLVKMNHGSYNHI